MARRAASCGTEHLVMSCWFCAAPLEKSAVSVACSRTGNLIRSNLRRLIVSVQPGFGLLAGVGHLFTR
jgi:hypothetical protein